MIVNVYIFAALKCLRIYLSERQENLNQRMRNHTAVIYLTTRVSYPIPFLKADFTSFEPSARRFQRSVDPLLHHCLKYRYTSVSA
jgi:hypothetical protein